MVETRAFDELFFTCFVESINKYMFTDNVRILFLSCCVKVLIEIKQNVVKQAIPLSRKRYNSYLALISAPLRIRALDYICLSLITQIMTCTPGICI